MQPRKKGEFDVQGLPPMVKSVNWWSILVHKCRKGEWMVQLCMNYEVISVGNTNYLANE